MCIRRSRIIMIHIHRFYKDATTSPENQAISPISKQVPYMNQRMKRGILAAIFKGSIAQNLSQSCLSSYIAKQDSRHASDPWSNRFPHSRCDHDLSHQYV